MVVNPNTNKYIHFGATGYEDFTNIKIQIEEIDIKQEQLK
jgi:hypothetical protein